MQVHDAKSSRSNDAADRIRFIIVSDFAESPETFVSNILLSIIQFAELVDEENDILRPSIRPESLKELRLRQYWCIQTLGTSEMASSSGVDSCSAERSPERADAVTVLYGFKREAYQKAMKINR